MANYHGHFGNPFLKQGHAAGAFRASFQGSDPFLWQVLPVIESGTTTEKT